LERDKNNNVTLAIRVTVVMVATLHVASAVMAIAALDTAAAEFSL
jgi:hypothetical protein